MGKLRTTLIIGAIILLSLGAFSVFSADSKDDMLYFPLDKPNTQWVYKVTLPGNKFYRQDLTVLETKDQSLQLGVTVIDNPEAVVHFLRNEQGLFKVKVVSANGVNSYEPAQLVLSSKLSIGKKWNWESATKKANMNVTVLNGGKIKVTAGTFNTILVRTEGTNEDGSTYVDQTWYAKGIGYVKTVATSDGKTSGEEELMSYKLGK